jgi:hypothetical protein
VGQVPYQALKHLEQMHYFIYSSLNYYEVHLISTVTGKSQVMDSGPVSPKVGISGITIRLGILSQFFSLTL